MKPDRSKSSVRFSFSAGPLWGGLRAWRNTSPEVFPVDRVLLSISRSRYSLPYNMQNFSDCRVRFFNIQEGGRFPPGSCFDRPRIAEKVGEPVEPSAHPHCGCSKPCKRVSRPCLHGYDRATWVSVNAASQRLAYPVHPNSRKICNNWTIQEFQNGT